MDPDDQALTSAILIACLIGISLCVILIIYVTATDYFYHGYTELYLKDTTNLPDSSEPEVFLNYSCTVVSHHKEQMGYEYSVYYDDEIIQSGTFLIPDLGSERSLTIPLSVNRSLLAGDTGAARIPGTDGINDGISAKNYSSAHTISVSLHETPLNPDQVPQSYMLCFPVFETNDEDK